MSTLRNLLNNIPPPGAGTYFWLVDRIDANLKIPQDKTQRQWMFDP